MTIWGRIAEATGLARGGIVRSAIGGVLGVLGLGGGETNKQMAFTIAVVALGAKMARADGIASEDEFKAFEEVFQVPEGERANVRRLFDLAKQDTAGYEAYADQLWRYFKDDRRLLQHVLEGLFHVATAEGVLHPEENAFLKDVATRFGFADSEFKYIRARFVIGDDTSPYDVLRLTPDASDEEIKAQYRQLVLQNHPDKLIARGVPPEFIDMANRKLAAINEAYAQIAKERKL